MKRSFWEEARTNLIISRLYFLLIFILYFILLRLIWDVSPLIALFSFFLALVYLLTSLIQPISFSSLAFGAEELRGIKGRMVKNIVEELKLAAQYKNDVKLYVVDDDFPNAFALSFGDKAMIGVTKGLLSFNREEITAVLAHEMSHLLHRDSEIKFAALIGIGAIEIALRLLRSDRKKSSSYFLVLIFGIFAYVLSYLLLFALSRRRELLADVEAVRLTRNKNALISALRKISAYKGRSKISEGLNAFLFFNPGTLFSTHPPLEERIRIIEEL